MLHLDVATGDKVEIDGGRIVIHVGQKSGQRTRLGIEADNNIKIRRVGSVAQPPEGVGARRVLPVE